MTPSRHQVIAPKPGYRQPLANPFSDAGAEASLTESLKVLFSRTHVAIGATKPPRERRATPRIPIELCCEDRTKKRPYYRTTYDLSTFGVSTQFGHSYPKGTVVTLRLHLPDDLRRPLDLTAEVVGTLDDRGGMRLAFRAPPAEAVRRIHRYLFARDAQVQGRA